MIFKSFLIKIFRVMRPVALAWRVDFIVRPIWKMIWRPKTGELVHVVQNDRLWYLDAQIAIHGEWYEPDTVGWIRRVVKPGMTVIDIGANVGQLTLEMAYLVGKEGKVIAIEPAPGNLMLLRKHLEVNGLSDRVIIIAAACCAKEAESITLTLPGNNINARSSIPQIDGLNLKHISFNPGENTVSFHVPAVTLDSTVTHLNLSHVDVIKIDVEGAEVEVLKGARETLTSFNPKMILGFHPFAFKEPEKAREEIEELLRQSGLHVKESVVGTPWIFQEYTIE